MFLETPIKEPIHRGWIEVIAGSMFSGKTEELIRRVKRAKIAQLKECKKNEAQQLKIVQQTNIRT